MKIAQIAPLIESVPPRFYGGTERVVSYLTEELVRLGHDVTLFASGDSVTSARLVSCATTALRLDPKVRDPIPYYMLMLDRVRECADDFDILHFHIDYFHFPLFRPLAGCTVTTLHGRQDLPDLQPLYLGFSEMPLVSISNGLRQFRRTHPRQRLRSRAGNATATSTHPSKIKSLLVRNAHMALDLHAVAQLPAERPGIATPKV
jgi:glycosyltransferase involved in cell wall biosynthesis